MSKSAFFEIEAGGRRCAARISDHGRQQGMKKEQRLSVPLPHNDWRLIIHLQSSDLTFCIDLFVQSFNIR